MSVSKFLIYELTVSIFCFFVLSHLRQDSPENIRGQENGMIPVTHCRLEESVLHQHGPHLNTVLRETYHGQSHMAMLNCILTKGRGREECVLWPSQTSL